MLVGNITFKKQNPTKPTFLFAFSKEFYHGSLYREQDGTQNNTWHWLMAWHLCPSPRAGKTYPEVHDPFLYTHIFICSIFMHAKMHSCNRRGTERWSPVKAVFSLFIGQELAVTKPGPGHINWLLWERKLWFCPLGASEGMERSKIFTQ